MKKLGLTILLLFIATSISVAQITGSKHDFSGDTWNSSGEICIVCHTPHNADLTVASSPLWNHELTTATFTMYTSNTMDATVGTEPTGESKLCLSCHDGVTAIDNFGTITTSSVTISGNANLGTNLMNDHPISITYDAVLAGNDIELHDPSTTSSGLGGTISADMLSGDMLQCSSCHDAHDGSSLHFLLKSNAASALCLTCHDK